MPPLLSGTHTLISFSPKLTGPKNNTSTWKRAAKTSHGSRSQLPQEECSPLHLADEVLVRCKKKKEEEEVEG